MPPLLMNDTGAVVVATATLEVAVIVMAGAKEIATPAKIAMVEGDQRQVLGESAA
jgi:hypothetical protein